ncbi:MAG: hypothetical protein J4215_01300 [Candidatus Diapherotrites archaeon]|uniref:Uncharacterized protein n=1 Tax=Candidatus Iainarchaeum sp. TaxID=3101447 RepID=A0A8T4L347_9ARCH|nr:hypothetical protein [Candidatus Diapherotrites archaeon]
MKNHGQTSIEMLVIAMFVLGLTAYFTTLTYSDNNDTHALLVAKTRLLEKINGQDKTFVLVNIQLDRSAPGQLIINASTVPATLKKTGAGNPGDTTIPVNDIETEIKIRTGDTIVQINLN